MIDFTSRKRCLVMLAWLLCEGAAKAALASQCPGGTDSCRVVAKAEPHIECKPSPPGPPVPGTGRIHTVPATLDCRAAGKHKGAYQCEPSFLGWAKAVCNGLDVRE